VQDELSQILAEAARDADFEQALRDDPRTALEDRGYDLSEDVVAHMLRRLSPQEEHPNDGGNHGA